MSNVWISKILDEGMEKIRREPDFFVALMNCDGSNNMCALFQK